MSSHVAGGVDRTPRLVEPTAGPPEAPSTGMTTVGRARELAAIQQLLDAEAGRLVLTGAMGLGRSHLARVAAGLAAERGWEVVVIAGSASTAAVPFAPWAHLLAEVPIDATPAALVAIALSELRARRAHGPVLVVIDDLHRLDEASLTMAVHVLREARLAVVATTRVGVDRPGGLADVLRDGRGATIDLSPLSRSDLATLATTVGAGDLDPGALAQLWRLTEGNPLYAVEFLRGGEFTRDPAVTLADVVGGRVAELPTDQRRLLELLAAGGTLDWRITRELVGDDAVLAAEQAGLVVAGAENLRVRIGLTHRLYAESLRTALGPLGLRSRLEELIAAATRVGDLSSADLVKLAVWRAELGAPFDPGSVGLASRELRWGFHDWLRRGLRGEGTVAEPRSDTDRVSTAYRLAGLAWEQDRDWATGHALLRALHDQPGRLDEFESVLAQVEPLCRSDEERATLTIVTALWLCWVAQRWPEAEARLLQWEARLGEPHRQLLACARGGLMVLRGDVASGMSVLAAHRPADSFPTAVRVAWSSPWTAGLAMSGRLDEAIATGETYLPLALELGDEAMVAVSELVLSSLWARLYRGDLEETEQRAMTMRDLAGDQASAEGLALLTGVAARSLLWQGKVTTAVDLLRDAVVVHESATTVGFQPLLHSTLSIALSTAGLPGAAEELGEARRLLSPPRVFQGDLATASALVAASHGRLGAGAAETDEAARDASGRGNLLFALLAAHTSVALAPDPSRCSMLVEVAAGMDGPLPRLLGQLGELARSPDAARAERIGLGFSELGANRQAWMAYGSAARLYRRDGHRALAARCEGAARRAVSHCEGLAGAPFAPVGVLTPREREVAALAAKGWSSADIADELGISPRTVESHLYRVFAKLAITTRAELTDSWLAQD